MEKIFVLGNSKTIQKLGFTFVEIPTLVKDSEIHAWICQLFNKNKIEKLVIEIGDNPMLALQIGYHIRLSIETLHEKTLIPMLYVSTLSLNAVMLETEIYSQILATKGIYFSQLEDIMGIKSEIELMEDLPTSDYLTRFLQIIHVQPDETIGRHSLANIWGAFVMDRAANTNALRQDADFKKKLYFKYVAAFNNMDKLKPSAIKTVGYIVIGKANDIPAQGKKILLIDDEADKGWETVLRKVFQTTKPEDFVVIKEKVKNFDAFSDESKKIIENEHFNLYLIDLRLNGLVEESNLKTADFSGMKVLQKIKSLNQGNQVIVFTASNKVWNLKALLDAGADGYYLKESPEYNFSNELSKQNYQQFQTDVSNCFERNYIKGLYSDIQNIQQKLSTQTYPKEFIDQLTNQLNLFFDMVINAKSETQFAYAYVTLYMVIEIVNNQFLKKVAEDKWEIENIGMLLDWKWNKETNKYESTGKEIDANNPPEWQKIAGLYFQKWSQKNNKFIHNISFLIQKRNGFVHNDKSILEKQDSKGKYLNKDVYTKEGVINLFEAVKKIIGFL
jgi:DNA-binding NarL/FixJ family response regulator